MSIIVVIHCARDSCNSKDDVIRIAKNNTMFTVKHTVPENEVVSKKPITTNMNLDYNGLYNYMNTLIELLHADKIPFKSIQFDFLCMPAVVVTPQNVKSVKKTILRYITTLSNATTNMETRPKQINPVQPMNWRNYFDEDDTVDLTYYS